MKNDCKIAEVNSIYKGRKTDRREFIKTCTGTTALLWALSSGREDGRAAVSARGERWRINKVANAKRTMFTPGEPWYDIDGNTIQAHGGGVLCDKGTYYWYGEHKGGRTYKPEVGLARVDVIGVSCYSSQDLYNWKYEGLALPAVQDNPAHDLHPGKVAERPKVIYNAKTKQYVMWLHIDTPDYRLRSAGIAVSDNPVGPFRYVASMHPNGLVSADQTLFKDDGAAYHIYSSNWNSCTIISRLADDYLTASGEYVCVFDYKKENRGKEAPAVCKRNGKYYMVGSECTGWAPNEASYAVANRMLGDWKIIGNPCVGKDSEKTFHAQSTFILPVEGKEDAFVFMADRWNHEDLGDSRYVWLPIRWDGDELLIEWEDEWNLSVFDAAS